MTFYTTSTGGNFATISSSGNVGIGTSPVSPRMTINSTGSFTLGTSSPSSVLDIHSPHRDEVDKRFFEIVVRLVNEIQVKPEFLRDVNKSLTNIGFSSEDFVNSFSQIDNKLSGIKCPRNLKIEVLDLFLFCVSYNLQHFNETDYIKIFESIDA